MNQTKSKSFTALNKNSSPSRVDEALVYLKLRQINCPKNNAILFTQKQNKKKFFKSDGTIIKDGPPNYRKLTPILPDEPLSNGWLINKKLSYKNTISPLKQIQQQQSPQRLRILKILQNEREQNKRISKSVEQLDNKYKLLNKQMNNKVLNYYNKMIMMKQQLLKQKQFRQKYIKCSNIKLYQTTKNFYNEWQKADCDNLIVQLSAFDTLMNKNLEVAIDMKKKNTNKGSPRNSPKNNGGKSPTNNSYLKFQSAPIDIPVFDFQDVQQKKKKMQNFQNSLNKLKQSEGISKKTLISTFYGAKDRQFEQNLQMVILNLRSSPTKLLENQNRFQDLKKLQNTFKLRFTKLDKIIKK